MGVAVRKKASYTRLMKTELLSTTRARRAAYEQIRAAVYEVVAKNLAEELDMPIQITPIGRGMLKWETVWLPAHPGRGNHGGFDWREIVNRFNGKHERLDAAIWSAGLLCGLAIGKPSKGKRHVSIYFLEGARHSPNPLKGSVLTIALLLANEYAKALGARYVRLMSPVEGLIPTYQTLGFRYVPKTTKCPAYCECEVAT
jgi:hypothetical protein